jgi:LCP family protein required for cell wall assembly
MSYWKAAVIAAIICFIGGMGYLAYAFVSFANDPVEESRFKQFETPPVPTWESRERVNVLLLGGDSRGLKKHEIPRSDTMIIVSIDPVTKAMHLFSLLRDTYVKIPGHGNRRINVAVVLGGPKLAMRTVSDLTGLNIQYYVYTDFHGFTHLIDAIGGIEYEVEKDMHYTSKADGSEYDIKLKKGRQHMDGHTALQYVRYRADARSDFSRTERQRKFMMAVAERLQTTSSILRFPRILHTIDPYIETNLNIGEMLKLGALGFEVRALESKDIQLPPSQLLLETHRGGASVIVVDKNKLKTFIQKELQ